MAYVRAHWWERWLIFKPIRRKPPSTAIARRGPPALFFTENLPTTRLTLSKLPCQFYLYFYQVNSSLTSSQVKILPDLI